MKIKIDTFIYFIENKINENQKILNSKKIILSEDIRKKLELKNEAYTELVNDIYKSYDIYCSNKIFDILEYNYNKYDTKITFWNGEELLIDKNTITSVEGQFIFIHNGYDNLLKPVNEGFNINNIEKIITVVA